METLVIGVPGLWDNSTLPQLMSGLRQRGYLLLSPTSIVLDAETQEPLPF